MKFLQNSSLAMLGLVLFSACGGGGDRKVIQNKGSDTLVNVAQAWAERYRDVDPTVGIAVSGGGSGTGISAMINGTVDIANASRAMKDKEIEQARANGIEPVELIVGYDAIAVFVHTDNPMQSITLAQIKSIYGVGGATTHWSQLGVTFPGVEAGSEKDEIIRISRQNNSGTYAYFQKITLGKGVDYKLGSLDPHGSKDVVEMVESTRAAIGYSGLAYATEHVRMLPVRVSEGAAAVVPSPDSAVDGSYPIARPLLMYTAGKPEGIIKAYLDWILSDAGQTIIRDKGYAPVRSL